MVSAAIAQARAAAREAKTRWRQERIDRMLEQIAGGRERDAAVFEARALGAALEDIGRAIGVTRERVRQICAATHSSRPPVEWSPTQRRSRSSKNDSVE
jgi:DNA-directed RNA polymerase sigma subunit (sigma70/sigma32)